MEDIRYATKLISVQKDKIIVVVSALKEVTDKLGEVSKQAKKGNKNYVLKFKEKILKEHLTTTRKAIIKDKGIREEVEGILKNMVDELTNFLIGITSIGELTPRSKDYILSFGERLSVVIFWGALRDLGLNSKYYTGKQVGIITDSKFGKAEPILSLIEPQVKATIEPLLEKGIIPVVTGYIGATRKGKTTTLGRGGSDYTAAILAWALNADEILLWKDVAGLMTSDPKITPKAKTIDKISYSGAGELALGAKVIFPETLELAREKKIPIRIKNIFNPESPETLITENEESNKNKEVEAVTLIHGALVNAIGTRMVGVPGTAAELFKILGDENINISMISQSVSETNISFVIQRKDLKKTINYLESSISGGVLKGLINEVTYEKVCVVAVIGPGIKDSIEVLARLFNVLKKEKINIRMMTKGSSKPSFSFAIKEKDGEKAVYAIHTEFIR